MKDVENHAAPRSLDRGLQVLEQVAREPEGTTFTAVQTALDLPKMTITRLLNALCALEYLEKGADGLYRTGPRFRALMDGEAMETRLRRACTEPLQRLVTETCNSGLLLHWEGSQLVCLERFLHERSIVLVPPGHVIRNIYLYPAGIFCLSPEHWEAEFAGRPGKLEAEGITRQWYEEETQRLRDLGYTTGHLADRHRIAAPLKNRAGAILGALLIGGTPDSLPEDALPEAGRLLAAAARECSRKLAATG